MSAGPINRNELAAVRAKTQLAVRAVEPVYLSASQEMEILTRIGKANGLMTDAEACAAAGVDYTDFVRHRRSGLGDDFFSELTAIRDAVANSAAQSIMIATLRQLDGIPDDDGNVKKPDVYELDAMSKIITRLRPPKEIPDANKKSRRRSRGREINAESFPAAGQKQSEEEKTLSANGQGPEGYDFFDPSLGEKAQDAAAQGHQPRPDGELADRHGPDSIHDAPADHAGDGNLPRYEGE